MAQQAGEPPRSSSNLLWRGIAVLAFGIVILVWPNISLAILGLAFGAFALFAGVTNLYSGLRESRQQAGRWIPVAQGVIELAIGAIVVWAVATGGVLTLVEYLIAAWAILLGIVDIMRAIFGRPGTENVWLILARGAVAIALGIWILTLPPESIAAFAQIIGGFAIALGVLMIGGALLRRRRAPGAPA